MPFTKEEILKIPVYYLYQCDNCLEIVSEKEEFKYGEKTLCRNCYIEEVKKEDEESKYKTQW